MAERVRVPESERPPELSVDSVVVAAPHHAACDLAGEAVILDLDSGLYYGLEAVGARIWELLRDPIRVAALRDTLLGEYDVAPKVCQSDLLAVLGELLSAGLIEVRHDGASG